MASPTVAEYMVREVVSVSPDMTVGEVTDKMINSNFHGFPIADKGFLLGFITAKELLKYCDRKDETIREVMKTGTICCKPNMTIDDAIRVLFRYGLRNLPVVDDSRKLVGIISNIDIVRSQIEKSRPEKVNNVKSFMEMQNSIRMKVVHNLLAKPGVKMEEIREIYSHEQAIQQCSAFLSRHKEWHVNVCTNTAAAARMVAESGRKDAAAISSGHCAALYGLDCLSSEIQNNSNNHTRFICISKKPEIYPGADHTSLMLVLPNHPGSLYQLLSRFNALDINLIKLESRPLPGRDFEFMFYFDLEASVGSSTFSRLIEELDITLNQFSYLGCYSEIV